MVSYLSVSESLHPCMMILKSNGKKVKSCIIQTLFGSEGGGGVWLLLSVDSAGSFVFSEGEGLSVC